jgi:hypothetical protein
LLPLFSICGSSGGYNLCFVLCYLCSQFVGVTNQRFLPPALSQIENRGNKNTKQTFYLQHSHKLRTEVTKTQSKDFCYLYSQFVGVLVVKQICFVFCYLGSQFVGAMEVKIFILCFVTSVLNLYEFLCFENRGNKTQSKNIYHQNSHKLRTEVTKHKTKIITTRTPTN